jgi:hypothetical protein
MLTWRSPKRFSPELYLGKFACVARVARCAIVVAVSLVLATAAGASPLSQGSSPDFNGDGKSDIMWRDTDGSLAIWLMNGAQAMSTPVVGVVPTSWYIVGTGNFDGSGKSAILWRNTDDGSVALWFMNGTQVTSDPVVAQVPTDWVVAGVGDFNGDGKSDILWRNTSDGSVALWLMNGSQVTADPVFAGQRKVEVVAGL